MAGNVANWIKGQGSLFQDTEFRHNMIDAHLMSRIVQLPVARQDFDLEEDLSKPLAPGITWRRRRFRFQVEENGATRTDALCINELTLDSNSAGELGPVLAADFPHLVDVEEIEHAYWETCWATGAQRSIHGSKKSRLFANMGRALYGEFGSDQRGTIRNLEAIQDKGALDDELMAGILALDPRFVDREDGEFGVVRWLPAFPPSRLVQSDASIVAATCAGFFLNFPEEYNDGTSAMHQPMGGHIIDGRMIVPPFLKRPGIMAYENGAVEAALFGPEILELRIDNLPPVPLHIPHFAEDPHGAVWRFFDSEHLAPPPGTAELVFSGPTLVHLGPARPDTRPPFGGAVIWVTGRHAEAAVSPEGISRISLSVARRPLGKPRWMITGGPFLMRDTMRITTDFMFLRENTGDFAPATAGPTRFPFDPNKTRAPRTAMGTTPAGGWKLVVVDGRRPGEHSMGLTLNGLAHLMQIVGCENAINLDGGGSAVMAIEGATHQEALTENCAYGVVNIPSDPGARERIIPVMLAVKVRP